MRLFKIKNKYLFKSDNPEGVHTYALYYDRKNKRYNAVATTHLYVKDKKRFSQIRQGRIIIERFKEFDTPTGVKNNYFSKNITGNNIDLNDSKNVVLVSKRHLPNKQSSRIKSFAIIDNNQKKKSCR